LKENVKAPFANNNNKIKKKKDQEAQPTIIEGSLCVKRKR